MLRDYALMDGVLAGGAVVVTIVQLARGRSLFDLLGSYSVTGDAHYPVDQVLKWLLYHLADLDLYLGIVPFAALLLLALSARQQDRQLRVFLAAALPLTIWLLVEVATFASAWSPRVQERNLFYVAPLFLIALFAWIERGLPRPARAAAAVAIVAAALPGALPYHRLIDASAESDTLALLPLWWLEETVITMDTVAITVVAAAIVVALVFLTVSPRYALVLPLIVLAWFAFATERIERFDHGFPKASIGALYQGITVPKRDWIDRAVGRDADVAFVFSGAHPTEQPLTLWENEFFNRSVGPVYDLKQKSMGGLPETHVIQRADGVLLAHGQPVRNAFVLSEAAVPLAGRVIARDQLKGMVLRGTDGLVRIGYRVTGLYPNDTWSGPRVTYTRLRCTGGSVTAQIASDPNLFSRPQTVSAGSRRVTFDPSESAHLTVPLKPLNGVCRVVFTVTPTAVPGGADQRILGAHFLTFLYDAP
jgi:hypothetical protein